MKATPIRMSEIIRQQTLTVELCLTGVRWARFRIWLGVRIIKLGAYVVGCGIEMKVP